MICPAYFDKNNATSSICDLSNPHNNEILLNSPQLINSKLLAYLIIKISLFISNEKNVLLLLHAYSRKYTFIIVNN